MGPGSHRQGLTSDPVAGLRRVAITQRAEVRGPVAAARRRLFAQTKSPLGI